MPPAPAPDPRPRPLAAGALVAVLVAGLVFYVVHATRLVPAFANAGDALRAVFVFGAIVWSAGCAGSAALRVLKVDPKAPAFRLALAVGLGFLAQYAAVVLLAVGQALSALTVLGVVAAPLLILRESRAAITTLRAWRPRRPRWTLPLALTAAFFAAYALLSLSPPCHVDEVTYHLSVPRDWLEHGGIPRDDGNFMAVFPPAMSAVYLLALGLGSDLAAKPLHFVGFLLMAAGLAWQARKLLGAGPARLAVLLFTAQWSVQEAVQRANNDFQWGYCGFFAFLVVVDTLTDAASPFGAAWPALAGLFLGGAIAGKLQSIDVVAGIEAVLALALVTRKVRLRDVVVLHLAAGLVYAPTLLRNLLYTGDPLFLTLAGRIGNPTHIDALEIARFGATSQIKRLFMTETNVVTLLLTPWFIFVDGRFPSTNYDGYIDPFALLVPVFLVLLARRAAWFRWSAVFLGAFYVMWVATAPQPRYGFPALPLLALTTVAGLRAIAPRGGARRALSGLVVTFASLSFVGMLTYTSWYLGNNLAVFAGLLPRTATLQRAGAQPTVDVAAFLDALEAKNGLAKTDPDTRRVYMVFASQTWYLGRPSDNDPFYVNLILLEQAEQRGEDPVQWLRDRGCRYVLTDFGRVPWMRDKENTNPWLNPYPDALARLDSMAVYWHRSIEPRLTQLTQIGGLGVWAIGSGTVPPQPGP